MTKRVHVLEGKGESFKADMEDRALTIALRGRIEKLERYTKALHSAIVDMIGAHNELNDRFADIEDDLEEDDSNK